MGPIYNRCVDVYDIDVAGRISSLLSWRHTSYITIRIYRQQYCCIWITHLFQYFVCNIIGKFVGHACNHHQRDDNHFCLNNKIKWLPSNWLLNLFSFCFSLLIRSSLSTNFHLKVNVILLQILFPFPVGYKKNIKAIN